MLLSVPIKQTMTMVKLPQKKGACLCYVQDTLLELIVDTCIVFFLSF